MNRARTSARTRSNETEDAWWHSSTITWPYPATASSTVSGFTGDNRHKPPLCDREDRGERGCLVALAPGVSGVGFDGNRRRHLRSSLAPLRLVSVKTTLKVLDLGRELDELLLLSLGVGLPSAVVIIVVGRRSQQPSLITVGAACRSSFDAARASDRNPFVLFLGSYVQRDAAQTRAPTPGCGPCADRSRRAASRVVWGRARRGRVQRRRPCGLPQPLPPSASRYLCCVVLSCAENASVRPLRSSQLPTSIVGRVHGCGQGGQDRTQHHEPDGAPQRRHGAAVHPRGLIVHGKRGFRAALKPTTFSPSNWGLALAAETFSANVCVVVKSLAWARRSRSESWLSRDCSWVQTRR